jgi:hypothetical protein
MAHASCAQSRARIVSTPLRGNPITDQEGIAMKRTKLLVALSLVTFAIASAYAADDKKKDEADKAATTSQDKQKPKQATGNGGKAAAGATDKKDEKKESK